jgi:hypothetical protein
MAQMESLILGGCPVPDGPRHRRALTPPRQTSTVRPPLDLPAPHHRQRTRCRAGQCLWIAVAVDDFPTRNKRTEQTRLVPVVLDLVTADDVEDAVAGSVRAHTRPKKIARLFRQAYAQGGVLTEADVSLLLHLPINTVSAVVLKQERETGQTIPRRGTIHDLGRSVTHKRIICYKWLVEKKTTSQVA